MKEYLKYWLIFKRRWLPMSLIFFTVLGLGIVRTLKEIVIYQATGQILLKKSMTKSFTGIQQDLVKEISFVGLPIFTEVAILDSQYLAQKTLKALHFYNMDPVFLMQNLTVENLDNSGIIKISYLGTDSKTPAIIVNTLMKIYVKNDIETNRAQIQSAIDFVSRQLPLQKAKLEKAEKKLQYFRQNNGLLNSQKEAMTTQAIIEELNQEIIMLNTIELSALNEKMKSIQNLLGIKSPSQAITASFLSESPSTRLVLKKLQDIQEEIKILGVSLTENHPIIINLREQEAILQKELKKRMKQNVIGKVSLLNNNLKPEKILQFKDKGVQQKLINEYNKAESKKLSLELKLKSLNQSIRYYQKRMYELPRLQLIEHQLKRQIKSDETSYKFLLSKYQELKIMQKLKLSNVNIITWAKPAESPIKSRRNMNITQGFVGGVILAGIAAFLLEKFDQKIKNIKTLKGLLIYDILGYIPKFTTSNLIPKIIVQHDPNSATSEAFRLVESNLRIVNTEKSTKVIVITSASNQEGKSTIAANLAFSISQLNHKVLLIDANFRSSNQHKIWDIPNEKGLSNFLANSLDLESIITQVEPNLHVIVAGQLNNNNPATLLSSSKMTDFIEKVREKYQIVIIDSPALTVTADAIILGKLSNGILLVVRLEMSETDNVLMVKDIVEKTNQNVLGIIVNYMRSLGVSGI